MFKKLGTFLNSDSTKKKLFCEALITLLVADFSNRLRPLERTTRQLGNAQPLGHTTTDKKSLALEIGKSVDSIARNLPWNITCLPQAVAVKRMLMRRGVPATLFFGVANNQQNSEKIEAHAWVAIANRIIIGGASSKSFTIVSAFA